MEFGSSIVVLHVLCAVHSVSPAAHAASSLVDECALSVLLDDWFSILIIIKVTSNLVWVEVVLLDIEWCGNFASVIKFFLVEHLGSIEVVDDITSLRINKITSLIGSLALLIFESTLRICITSDNITFFISIEITNNITFIESS